MMINWVIGAGIFAYAAWQMVKFINKSKKGKCAACSVSKNCTSKSC